MSEQPPMAAAMLKPIFGGPLIAAGGFDGPSAESVVASGDADLVAFGRHVIANPDLPARLRDGLALNQYDRATFYYGAAKGYADYPFHEAVAASSGPQGSGSQLPAAR